MREITLDEIYRLLVDCRGFYLRIGDEELLFVPEQKRDWRTRVAGDVEDALTLYGDYTVIGVEQSDYDEYLIELQEDY